MARITLEIPKSAMANIAELKDLGGHASTAQLIGNALAVYSVVLKADTSGLRVFVEDADGHLRKLIIRE